jgi:uncharacterized LabA/DUF88 family protein
MDSYKRRAMLFIDATNFLSGLAREIDRKFEAYRPPFSVFEIARRLLGNISNSHNRSYPYKVDIIIRRFWFGSYRGDDDYAGKVCKEIRSKGFEPVLFKQKDGKEKGLDIALAKEMLINAFNQNYDVGYLIAGDADYKDLVYEVKRYGQIIDGAFFEGRGLSDELRLAVDHFHPISLERNNMVKEVEAVKNEISNSSNECNICGNTMTRKQYHEICVGENLEVCSDCLASVKTYVESMKNKTPM